MWFLLYGNCFVEGYFPQGNFALSSLSMGGKCVIGQFV